MKLQYFKPSLLTCAAMLGVLALVAPANAKVTIERDGYGVPKITADTDQEMWFAFGFAQARDRLLQLEVLRQEAYGELPTHPDPTVNDPRRTRNWRRLHLFPNLKSTLNREWLSLITLGHKDKSLNTLKTKDALSCFSLGIQAFKNYIFGVPYHSLCKVTEENAEGVLKTELGGDAKQEIEFIKGVFKSQNLPKTEWKAVDSLALFHLRVMHEFSLRNTEMKNLQLLNDLVNTQRSPEAAAQLFNSVKWALTPGAKTTIPTIADHKRSATQKSLQYHQELVGSTKLEVDEQPRELNGCNIYNPNGFDKTVNESITLTSTDMDTATFPRNASNWWVISQPDANQMQGASPSTPNSLLYNGPQITALDPSHTYQVALQSSEGFQFGGNAYIGSLNFWQGHNDTMAFGLTAGNNDVADVFCVPVRKEDGRWRYRGGPAFEPVLSEAAAAEFQAVAGQRDNQGFFGKQLDNMYTVGRTGWPVLAIDEADDQING
ncbi:MAG: penicillin acylase family protein, partial [Sneathiella sp.]